MSKHYVRETFRTGEFSDVVYITANPFFHPSKFTEITHRPRHTVFKDVYDVYLTDWSAEKQTVLAQDVCKAARQTHKEYPESRKVLHFMQPHHPFIAADIDGVAFGTTPRGKDVWMRAETGELDGDTVWEAYRKNLEYVLPYARDIGRELPGKSVITADHGNLVGEVGLYGHGHDLSVRGLREVPWHEL